MTSAEDWAVRIAEAAAPEEAELAPLWVEAFVSGGRDRSELFSRTNSQASAFLPGDLMPVLPAVFKSLAFAAPALLAMLTSDLSGKFLEAVKNAFALGEIFGKGRGWFAASPRPDAVQAPEAVCTMLNDTLTKLDKELRPLGLDQARRDRINLIVLRLLLENPPDAARFVEKLAEKR